MYAAAVRRSLVDSRDGPFKVEWVSGCAEAVKRLRNHAEEQIEAVVVDLFLPDSEGIETFERLLRASPHTAILLERVGSGAATYGMDVVE